MRRIAATGALSTALGLALAPAALAETGSGGVDVVNTETVQVYLSPTGSVESKRVYEQLALSGHGKVDLANPVSTSGLRNLDGFGGFTVKDGKQLVDTEVDGTRNYRSVSNYSGALPISITPAYRLDGKKISPDDLVGKSGHLEVSFKVVNKTAKAQEITVDDGAGGTVTKTVQVPVPMVGSLSTTTPRSFRNVAAGGANTAGDGQGGTKLSYTMTLFPPLGSDTAVLAYSADVKDAVVPQVDVALLPVDPLASPTFKTAATSYQGGASTGAQLVEGAGEIDGHLLELRDGAARLLAGLLKLRAGADQLHGGLADDAAPGSKRLAAGTDELRGGLTRLSTGASDLAAGTGEARSGAGDLAAGADELSAGIGEANAGTGDLSSGARQLAAGQQGLAAGLKDLYDGVQALPTQVKAQLSQNADYLRLLGGLDAIVQGIGTRADSPAAQTLLGGLNAIQYGMRAPGTTDCQKALVGQEPTNCGALDGIDLVSQTVTGALTGPASQAGTIAQLLAGFDAIAGTPDCGAVCQGTVGVVKSTAQTQLTQSLGLIKGSLDAISSKVSSQLLASGAGLDQLRAGLDMGTPGACNAPGDCGIKQAVQTIKAGVPMLVDQLLANISQQLLAGIGAPTAGCDPEATLRCGAAALVAGTNQLADGVDQLASGMAKLSAGGLQLSGGADALAAGLGKIDDGAGQLSEGARQASDGSVQLSDGAHQLADGLGDAADGSGQIAAGLGDAAAGAPQLVDGAGRISKEGMGQLSEKGSETAVSYGEMYATIQAGSERAHGSSMAFGAPEGAEGLTAYSFVIKGDDGETSRNWTRTGAAALVLAASGGVLFWRRRLVI